MLGEVGLWMTSLKLRKFGDAKTTDCHLWHTSINRRQFQECRSRDSASGISLGPLGWSNLSRYIAWSKWNMCRRTSSGSMLTVMQPAQTVSNRCRQGETQNLRLSQGTTRPTCSMLDEFRRRGAFEPELPEEPSIESGGVLGNTSRAILSGSIKESRRRRARRIRECLRDV